ncbi:hypothetical protein Y032_0162g3412 [Ancylostoma ceylanicum]|uniref:Uncharacterized protein n=1 Tax=Ancylostoma ceylanicum TaxID=53326 RepID=A0A016SXI9_9BILA|nr:hypothetical protein Y032_0162g3412 [Ancylostoma ceylanicum]
MISRPGLCYAAAVITDYVPDAFSDPPVRCYKLRIQTLSIVLASHSKTRLLNRTAPPMRRHMLCAAAWLTRWAVMCEERIM